MENETRSLPQKRQTVDLVESLFFQSRWILAPMYIALMLALVVYSFKCVAELWDLLHHFFELSEGEVMVGILNLVDISMVGNLVIMITIGGYSIFLRRLHISDSRTRPQWLDHIDTTRLKVKMGLSLIGVSSIYLLKSFISAEHVDPKTLHMQIAIHLVFVLSTLVVAIIFKLTTGNDHSTPQAHSTEPAHSHEEAH